MIHLFWHWMVPCWVALMVTHKSDKNLWQFYCPHNYCTVWSYLFVRSRYESCINRCSNIKCHPMKCLQSTNIVIHFLGKYSICIHCIFTSILFLYSNFLVKYTDLKYQLKLLLISIEYYQFNHNTISSKWFYLYTYYLN